MGDIYRFIPGDFVMKFYVILSMAPNCCALDKVFAFCVKLIWHKNMSTRRMSKDETVCDNPMIVKYHYDR